MFLFPVYANMSVTYFLGVLSVHAVITLLAEMFNAITLNKWKKDQYQILRTFTGTVIDVQAEHKKLVLMEHGVEPGASSKFYVPVDNPASYELGQTLEVAVYENESDQTWSLDGDNVKVKSL